MTKILLMGGTIDSFWDSTKDTAITYNESIIPDYVKFLKLENISFDVVCMKDSRSVNENDRKKLIEYIKNSGESKFIVTHGTYTMVESAQYIKDHLEDSNKTIVFTGSMVPLKGFFPTDAPFNLGFALAKADNLESGVYVLMNGKIFEPENVQKNLDKGMFEGK